MKRWANFYLQLSPIFRAPEFSQPGNEEIMSINSRLHTAYCAGMLRGGHYDQAKVKSILHKSEVGTDFSTLYLQYLLGETQECPTNQAQEQHVENVTKFRKLIQSLFCSELKRGQVSQLWKLLKGLTSSGYNLVHELDYFLIGASLNTLPQLAQFSESVRSQALRAVSHQILPVVENHISQLSNCHIFSLITILNRLSSHIPQDSPLVQLGKLYSLQPSKMKFPPLRQILGFTSWLLHVRDLNDFVYKTAKQNYLLSEYGDKSMSLLTWWIEKLNIKKEPGFCDLVISCEVVGELRALKEKVKFYENVKDDAKFARLLDSINSKLVKHVDQQGKKDPDPSDTVWVSQLLSLEVYFNSNLGKRVVELRLKGLLENPHASILFNQKQKHELLKLCTCLREVSLFKDFKQKMKINLQQQQQNLLSYLQSSALGQFREQPLPQDSWKIESLNDLRKIKQIIVPMATNHSLLQKNPKLARLRQALIEPDESHRQDLQVLFTDFQL